VTDDSKNKATQLDALIGIIVKYTGLAAAPAQIEEVRHNLEQALAATPGSLTLVLPAFPFKSVNTAEKVSGPDPDFGEAVALKTLNRLCEELAAVLPVTLRIVSDGHVFNDILGVPDEGVDAYFSRLKAMNTSPHIEFCRLKDLMGQDAPIGDLRAQLVRDFAENMEDVCKKLLSNEGDLSLYRGMKHFMEEEVARAPGESRTHFNKRAGDMAKQIYQRSQAYSKLVAAHFPESFRLSIHPHEDWAEKTPIRLVPSNDRWATPWHNVAVWNKADGSVTLMPRAQAEKAHLQSEKRNGKIWRYVASAG
jgi:pyoverdine/dityrosine biosynthesis protein Dit1